MIRFFLFIILLLSSFAATSQGLAGYIIPLSGDTLRGYVREKNGGQLLFYATPTSAPQRFRATQVRGYGIGRNAPILSHTVHLSGGADSVRFVLPQIAGLATLYSYANDRGLLLGTTATDTLYELDQQNWHLLFNRFLRACPTLNHTSEQMLNMPFSELNVQKVVLQYNQCAQPQAKVAARPRQNAWRQGLVGRFSGFYSSQKQFWPNIGVEWAGLRANGLQVSVQLDYTFVTERSDVYEVGTNFLRYEECSYAQLQLLSPGVAVGKRFGRPQRPSLYIGAGLGFDFVVQDRIRYEQRPLGSTADFSPVRSGRFAVGSSHLDACAGVVFPLSASQEVRLNAISRTYLRGPLLSLMGAQLAYGWYWH